MVAFGSSRTVQLDQGTLLIYYVAVKSADEKKRNWCEVKKTEPSLFIISETDIIYSLQ